MKKKILLLFFLLMFLLNLLDPFSFNYIHHHQVTYAFYIFRFVSFMKMRVFEMFQCVAHAFSFFCFVLNLDLKGSIKTTTYIELERAHMN